MRNNLKKILKMAAAHYPPLESFIQKQYIKKKFHAELDLINGVHRNVNNHTSIICFSINKAATQYVNNILSRCAIQNGMTSINIQSLAFNSDIPFLFTLNTEEMVRYRKIFKPNGYLYVGFGWLVEGIPDLEKFKAVLMVRDPRDILVSSYFSKSFSHPLPPGNTDKHRKFIEMRNATRQMSIDDYVIGDCQRVYDILLKYKNEFIDKISNIYITKYENMVSDFQGWLKELIDYCEFDITKELYQALLIENRNLKPRKENIYQHIRKGQPGDYKEKLKPETVDFLNKKFAPILYAFEY